MFGQAVAEEEDSGKVIGYIGTITDITEHKRAEEALYRSEKHYRAIMDNVAEGIITIDDHGIIESFNPAAQRIFGYSGAEAIGQNISMLMPEPDPSRHDGYLAGYLKTGKPKILGKGPQEVVGQRKDGSTFPMELATSEFYLKNKRIFIGVVRDLTERKKVEQELREKEIVRAGAVEASRAKSDFLSSMSHDLRTPLTGIIGAAETIKRMVKKGLTSEERLDKLLKNIIGSGWHLSSMVEDVLDISRIESGRMKIQYECVNLKQVLDGLYSNLNTQASEKGLAFELDVPDDFPPVRADEKRLTQVLFNLAGNAVKFTEAGKIIISARSSKEDKKLVVISVSDTGIGIPEEYLSRIFDRFERVDQSGKKVGTGLGLAITKKLVEIMGGEIRVESRVGEGSTFHFTLRKWK